MLWLYCSGSGSVSGNVLKRMSRHTVVTLNSDSRTCNAEAVHKWTQTGTSDKCRKTVRAVYTHVVNVTGVTADAAWTPPVIRHPLVPLREHSRPGWFLERRRTCRHLQTTEDAGIAVNDLELPAGAVELDGTPESSTMPRVILKKRVQPAMESVGLKWFPAYVADHSRHWSRRFGAPMRYTFDESCSFIRWTISSWSTYFCWYGSQIQEQYSSLGWTIALYDFSFNCCGHLFRDRRRNSYK